MLPPCIPRTSGFWYCASKKESTTSCVSAASGNSDKSIVSFVSSILRAMYSLNAEFAVILISLGAFEGFSVSEGFSSSSLMGSGVLSSRSLVSSSTESFGATLPPLFFNFSCLSSIVARSASNVSQFTS